MLTKFLLSLGWLILLTGAGASPEPIRLTSDTPQTDETAQRIIGLYFTARGGKEYLLQLQSIRFSGILKEGGEDIRFIWWQQLPDNWRMDHSREKLGWTYSDRKVVTAEHAWHELLLPEKRQPQDLPPPEAEILRRELSLIPALLHPEEHGVTFHFRGESTIGDRKAYHIVGRWPSGEETGYDFDQKNFHLLNVTFHDIFAGRKTPVKRLATGLRKVGNLWWETGYDYRLNGSSYRRIEFSEIVLNPETSPETYTRPQVKEIWLRGE